MLLAKLIISGVALEEDDGVQWVFFQAGAPAVGNDSDVRWQV